MDVSRTAATGATRTAAEGFEAELSGLLTACGSDEARLRQAAGRLEPRVAGNEAAIRSALARLDPSAQQRLRGAASASPRLLALLPAPVSGEVAARGWAPAARPELPAELPRAGLSVPPAGVSVPRALTTAVSVGAGAEVLRTSAEQLTERATIASAAGAMARALALDPALPGAEQLGAAQTAALLTTAARDFAVAAPLQAGLEALRDTQSRSFESVAQLQAAFGSVRAELPPELQTEATLAETAATRSMIEGLVDHGAPISVARQALAQAMPSTRPTPALAGRQFELSCLDAKLCARDPRLLSTPASSDGARQAHAQIDAAFGTASRALEGLEQGASLQPALQAERQVTHSVASAATGDRAGQATALSGALSQALGLPPEALKKNLTPTEALHLNADGSNHHWYNLSELFTSKDVPSLSAGQVKGLADAVLAAPAEQQAQAIDALARTAEAAAGSGELGELQASKQVLHELAARTGRSEFTVASRLAEAQFHLGLGDPTRARDGYLAARQEASKVSDTSSRAGLEVRALQGEALALSGIATSGTHDQKLQAIKDLRELRVAAERAPSRLRTDQLARLTTLEMSAELAADSSAQSLETLHHLDQTYSAQLPWVKASVAEFTSSKHKGGVQAFIQTALHEANSESTKEGLAVSVGGSAAGAAIGATAGAFFFGVGAIPGAFLGATIGGAVSTLGLKVRNLVRGADQIAQAARTGYDNQTLLESAMDATSLAMDVVAAAAPVKGLGSVGKGGLTALTGLGTAASKVEAEALMRGLTSKVQAAAGKALSGPLATAEAQSLAKQLLFREVSKSTAEFGGTWLSRGALATLTVPMANELVQIQTSDLTPAQKSAARSELARHFAQSLLTTAATMAPMMALGHASSQPIGSTARMKAALAEFAPTHSEVRALSPDEFKRVLAERRQQVESMPVSAELKGQLQARYAAIDAENVAAFDPLTGHVLINSAELNSPKVKEVLGHELTHLRTHSLPVATREGVVKAFTGSERWQAIKGQFLEHNPSARGFNDAQIVDEVLAEVHGQPGSAFARLCQPVLETKAVKGAGLDRAPKVDLTELRRSQVATVSRDTYFNRSGETELVGYSEADAKVGKGGYSQRPSSVAQAYVDGLTEALGIPADRRAQRTQVTTADELAFYRANPALFAFDEAKSKFALIDRKAPKMTIVGDAHLFNFGRVRTSEGGTAWGLNDFDQAHLGSPESDLKRLATSVVLTARSAKLNAKAEQGLVEAVAAAYSQEVSRLAEGGTPHLYLDEHSSQGAVSALVESAEDVHRKDFLEGLTHETKHGLKFKENDSLRAVPASVREDVAAALEQYAKSLPADARVKTPLVVLDVAEQIGKGGSSNGMDRYAVLVEHATKGKRPIVLEVKHCPPAPNGGPVSRLVPSDAGRIVDAQARLGGLENALTGSATLDGKSMLVREYEPVKAKLDAVDLTKKSDLEQTAVQAARVLAAAHAQSGGAQTLAKWIGADAQRLGARLADFASGYATQVETDFAAIQL